MASERTEHLKSVNALGFVVDGVDGCGHVQVHHPATGARYSVASSPSDWRARRNELAELERIAGKKLPRQKSGKYRCRRQEVADFEKTQAELDAAVEIDELLLEAEELRLQFAALPPTHGAIAEARKVVERFEAIRDRLAERYRIIPSLDSVTY